MPFAEGPIPRHLVCSVDLFACLKSSSFLALAHVLQVLHREAAGVEEPVRAVGHAALLALVHLARLDGARHALVPADVCEGVDGYKKARCCQLLYVRLVPPGIDRPACLGKGRRCTREMPEEKSSLTRLDARLLVLVGQERAQLLLVLLVELLEVKAGKIAGVHGVCFVSCLVLYYIRSVFERVCSEWDWLGLVSDVVEIL